MATYQLANIDIATPGPEYRLFGNWQWMQELEIGQKVIARDCDEWFRSMAKVCRMDDTGIYVQLIGD